MPDEITEAPGAQATDGLRDIPADIGEYQKFVKEGGLEHNDKVLKTEASVAAAKAAGIPLAEPETAEQVQERHKFKSRAQRRITELNRRIGERDQRIRDLEQRISAPAGTAAASKEAAPQADKPRPNGEVRTPPKPKDTDFQTYGEYTEALAEWVADRKLEAADAKRAEAAAKRTEADRGREVAETYSQRVDEAKKVIPDWDASFKGLKEDSYTETMLVFNFESEQGPYITHFLATHRDELERIGKLSPMRQVAELGKIEDRITRERAEADKGEGEGDEDEAKGKKEPPEKPKPRVSSKAPPPEKPIAGRGSGDDPMPDPSDFKAYEAWSKRQAAKGVKRTVMSA